jgi:hypothetical protein
MKYLYPISCPLMHKIEDRISSIKTQDRNDCRTEARSTSFADAHQTASTARRRGECFGIRGPGAGNAHLTLVSLHILSKSLTGTRPFEVVFVSVVPVLPRFVARLNGSVTHLWSTLGLYPHAEH